jgi:hypothetical protein
VNAITFGRREGANASFEGRSSAVIHNIAREGATMNQHDNKQPKKLSLSRETVRILSNPEGSPTKKEITTPFCTDGGPRCEG